MKRGKSKAVERVGIKRKEQERPKAADGARNKALSRRAFSHKGNRAHLAGSKAKPRVSDPTASHASLRFDDLFSTGSRCATVRLERCSRGQEQKKQHLLLNGANCGYLSSPTTVILILYRYLRQNASPNLC